MTVCFSDIRIDRKKVRRMYLKIHRDGSVSMTVPAQAGQETVRLFFEEKKTWVEETLRHMPAQPHHTYVQGEKHFFMGRTVFLECIQGSPEGCRIDGERACLTIPAEGGDPRRLMIDCWKKALERQLQDSVRYWEAAAGVRAAGFSVKEMKTRWGTCHLRTGKLCFALELASKPVLCIEYVVLHELTHLLEAGHTPRFHAIMSYYMPDWKERKKILNESPREFM